MGSGVGSGELEPNTSERLRTAQARAARRAARAKHRYIDLGDPDALQFMLPAGGSDGDGDAVASCLESAAARLERAARETRAAAHAARSGTPLDALQAVVHAEARKPATAAAPPASVVSPTTVSSGGIPPSAAAETSGSPSVPPPLLTRGSSADEVPELPSAASEAATPTPFRQMRASFAGRASMSGGRKSFAALYTEEKAWAEEERKSIAVRESQREALADEDGPDEGGVPSTAAAEAAPEADGYGAGLSLDDRLALSSGEDSSRRSAGAAPPVALLSAESMRASAASDTSGLGGEGAPSPGGGKKERRSLLGRVSSALGRKSLQPAAETDVERAARERLERLAKLEEAQARALEEQHRAARELVEMEEEAASAAAEAAAAEAAVTAASEGRGRKASLVRRASSALFRKPRTSAAPPAAPEEPPRWLGMLMTFREQRAQIEGWLQCEPTEEEIADGSALQKAFTLMSARDELDAKIEQLEAMAAQEGGSPPGQPTSGRYRSASVAGSI